MLFRLGSKVSSEEQLVAVVRKNVKEFNSRALP